MRLLIGVVALLSVACAGDSELFSGSGQSIDGDWELVSATFDGEVVQEPLFLRVEGELLRGNNGCNSFGEEPNGEIVQTAAGCEGLPARLEQAVMFAIRGEREILDDGQLSISNGDTVLLYRPLERIFPAELYSILASDAPDVDGVDVPFEAEGGPPRFDRLVLLEDDGHPLKFYIGENNRESITLYVGIDGPPATSAQGGGSARDGGRTAITVLAGGPEVADIIALAALIPDAHLDDTSREQLQELGGLHGNLLIAEPQLEGLNTIIVNESGSELTLNFPTVFQG